MPSFSYIAMDRVGKDRKGLLNAPTREAAAQQLRQSGLVPRKIVPTSRGRQLAQRLAVGTLNRINNRQGAAAALADQRATIHNEIIAKQAVTTLMQLLRNARSQS